MTRCAFPPSPPSAAARRASSDARKAADGSASEGASATVAAADEAVAKLENVARMVGAALQRLRLPPAMRLLDELMSMQVRAAARFAAQRPRVGDAHTPR